MNQSRSLHFPFIVVCLLAFQAVSFADSPKIRVMRTPEAGIQPQVVVDGKGVVHLLYYKGDPKAGDLFYVRSKDNGETFSKPMRVNSEADTVVATGTIRGGQLAIGREGRAYVAWNGSRMSVPADQRKDHHNTPMLYTRLNDKGDAFEPQRNMLSKTHGLDGGGSVAADANGHVYLVWHGIENGKAMREENRAVWVRHSADDGKTFAVEQRANSEPTGVCGCCGLRSGVDGKGQLLIMYRTAQQFINRDMRLLVSADQTKTFKGTTIDPWRIGQCPMSSTSITSSSEQDFVAWETNKHVSYQAIDRATHKPIGKKVTAMSRANAKHPVTAVNSSGDVLLVWTEGMGWKKGGGVAWQLFGKRGKPSFKDAGRHDGVPVWSFAAVFATRDGGFVIVY